MNKYGFFRVAAATPDVHLADPGQNVRSIAKAMSEACAHEADVVVFPELSLTGYTCADLFHNQKLLANTAKAFESLLESSLSRQILAIVGMPLPVNGALYNVAAFVYNGRVLAFVPKTYIPNYNEFYEKRWWASATTAHVDMVRFNGSDVPFGTDILVDVDGVKVSAEICEDLWTPLPPSSLAAMAGAEVIFNLSASDTLVGKRDYAENLVCQQSARCIAGYVYASGAHGESTTDLVFKPLRLIAANGRLLAGLTTDNMLITDINIPAIRRDRMHITSFNDCAAANLQKPFRVVNADIDRYSDAEDVNRLLCEVDPRPFVSSNPATLDQRCAEVIEIQSLGLQQRLRATGCKTLVVGISGGLDSTLALLVAVHAFDALGIPRTGVIGVTMPGFGTTGRTHQNAVQLMQDLGVTIREISIVPAVQQHFKDIGHNPDITDVTYENAQARQRTYLLMDIANQANGMVLGTGDMSELALGWATYNGDHMSMYGVNAGVPKTLVKHLVRHFADTHHEIAPVLLDILDTPISPELLPAKDDGTIGQKTEDLVGPYELHDFFLYYMLRYGFDAEMIAYLAEQAFGDAYAAETIHHWLDTFMRRFFAQQFKRSCLPDGPKVGSVCLSPRGDWRMPSDCSSSAFRPDNVLER